MVLGSRDWGLLGSNILLIDGQGQVVDIAVQRESAVQRSRESLRHGAAIVLNTT